MGRPTQEISNAPQISASDLTHNLSHGSAMMSGDLGKWLFGLFRGSRR